MQLSRKKEDNLRLFSVMLSSLACVPGGWISGKVAADLIEGPKRSI